MSWVGWLFSVGCQAVLEGQSEAGAMAVQDWGALAEVMKEHGPQGRAILMDREDPQATHVLSTHPHFLLGLSWSLVGPCN